MNRRIAAIATLVLVVSALVVGVLLSNSQDGGRREQARIYCGKEPGLAGADNPEFKTCVDNYVYRR